MTNFIVIIGYKRLQFGLGLYIKNVLLILPFNLTFTQGGLSSCSTANTTRVTIKLWSQRDSLPYLQWPTLLCTSDEGSVKDQKGTKWQNGEIHSRWCSQNQQNQSENTINKKNQFRLECQYYFCIAILT